MVFFFNEQQPYINRVSDEILAAKLKAYRKLRLGHLDWVFLNGVRGLGLREPICADLGHLELIRGLGLLELFCGLDPLERITRIWVIVNRFTRIRLIRGLCLLVPNTLC